MSPLSFSRYLFACVLTFLHIRCRFAVLIGFGILMTRGCSIGDGVMTVRVAWCKRF
jgi:hypothetical protein